MLGWITVNFRTTPAHSDKAACLMWLTDVVIILRSSLFLFPASPTPEPEPPVTMENTSVTLLTSVRPTDRASSSPAFVGPNSQEQLVSNHWFSAHNLTEDQTVYAHTAGTSFHHSAVFMFVFVTFVPLPKRLCPSLLCCSEILPLSSQISTLIIKIKKYQISLLESAFRGRNKRLGCSLFLHCNSFSRGFRHRYVRWRHSWLQLTLWSCFVHVL